MGVKLLPKIFRRRKTLNTNVHICDIVKGSESHLPRLPPNARFSARFKRRLQKVLLVSADHPFTKLYLRSKAAIAFEKRRHGISRHWWIIHPCSNFRYNWDVVMFVTTLYLFITIPHMLAFHRLPRAGTNVVKYVLSPAYVVCIFDICFNFFTGYIAPDGHEIFLDPVLIIRHYSTRFFLIDLLSSVPYWWFYDKRILEPGPDIEELHLLAIEMLTLLKIARISSLRSYVKELAPAEYEHGLWLVLFTFLMFHWAACFIYFNSLLYAYLAGATVEEAEGLIFAIKLHEKPNWFIYLTSFHIGGADLCGYNGLKFQNSGIPDKVSRSILLCCGLAYYLYVIVIVLQVVGSLAEPELKYQAIMQGVKDYIISKKLPPHVKERLLNFYDHRFQGSLFKEKAITSTLSSNLKHEITQHSSRILLESTPLFHNISRTLLNNIIGALKQDIFLKNDVIYKANMEGKCMYFIVTGTIALITFSGKEVCHIHDGDYFGEIALIQHDHRRTTSAIALEVCEVLRLASRDFSRLVLMKSEFYRRLESEALKRLAEVERIENGGSSLNPSDSPSLNYSQQDEYEEPVEITYQKDLNEYEESSADEQDDSDNFENDDESEENEDNNNMN